MEVGCGALNCIFHMEVGPEALKHELPQNFTALEGGTFGTGTHRLRAAWNLCKAVVF